MLHFSLYASISLDRGTGDVHSDTLIDINSDAVKQYKKPQRFLPKLLAINDVLRCSICPSLPHMSFIVFRIPDHNL